MSRKGSYNPAVTIIDEPPIDGTINKPDPNKLLHDFLEEHKLKLIVEAIDEENPFIGTGFILTDKPLLKIVCEHK